MIEPPASPGVAPRVLVIFPGALGDLICAGPALDAIARAHHPASIELMAKAELARFAVGRFRVGRGHSIDRPEVAALFADAGELSAGAREFFSQFSRLYSYLAHDDQHFRASLEQCTPGRTVFLPFRPPGSGHVAAEYLKMIDHDAAEVSFRISLSPDDLRSAAAALKAIGIESTSRFVAIFPGSGSRGKNWPIANYLGLAAAIPRHVRPLFILGPAEAHIEPEVAASGFPALNGLDLAGVAGVARLADAFVGNDSGVSHLATAVGSSGVVIFGPTSPERWRPLGDVTVVARPSLDSVAVSEVAEALAAMLKGAHSGDNLHHPAGERGLR